VKSKSKEVNPMAGYRKLGLPTDQRKAMLRNLVTSLLKHGKIETTDTRAKETRSIAEKMITLGKRGDLHARRQVLSYVQEELVVKNLFDNVAPKYAERNGGYTRIIKKGPRRGDGAEIVILELV
jgi:large subunit ribosomal protein L17